MKDVKKDHQADLEGIFHTYSSSYWLMRQQQTPDGSCGNQFSVSSVQVCSSVYLTSSPRLPSLQALNLDMPGSWTPCSCLLVLITSPHFVTRDIVSHRHSLRTKPRCCSPVHPPTLRRSLLVTKGQSPTVHRPPTTPSDHTYLLLGSLVRKSKAPDPIVHPEHRIYNLPYFSEVTIFLFCMFLK